MDDVRVELMSSLPIVPDGELEAMNQLMADKKYRIKQPGGFLRADKTDRVSKEFVLYTLNDHIGHVQRCVASTKRMLPYDDNGGFYAKFATHEPVGHRVMATVAAIDIRQLGNLLMQLQSRSGEVSVRDLVPFVRLLYRSVLRVYYLGPQGIARVYRAVHAHILRELVPQDPAALKDYTASAIAEWRYIMEQMTEGLYPLLLRMTSPQMLSQAQLFYANGSRLLAWLGLEPNDVIFLKDAAISDEGADGSPAAPPEPEPEEEGDDLPEEVREGLAVLEVLFPEAGWDRLETLPDMCPYFQSMVQFQDGFTQLAPDNPLHHMMILFWILEELFQGLRLIKFEPLQALSARDDFEDINRILEDWIRYQETIFDKGFSVELKAYTHQIYTQPDFHKTPYGRKLLSNMYTLIKAMFLPYFDIRMYGTTRGPKDERFPPFFVRVSRLTRMLTRYNEEIEAATTGSEPNPDDSVPGVLNPWAPYKFDIPNHLSRRLDAICGGRHSRSRTNAFLIRYTLSILNVLDWWVNDKTSYAYRDNPDYLYRVIEPGSSVPAFGVRAMTDVDAIFQRHLKARAQGGAGEQ